MGRPVQLAHPTPPEAWASLVLRLPDASMGQASVRGPSPVPLVDSGYLVGLGSREAKVAVNRLRRILARARWDWRDCHELARLPRNQKRGPLYFVWLRLTRVYLTNHANAPWHRVA